MDKIQPEKSKKRLEAQKRGKRERLNWETFGRTEIQVWKKRIEVGERRKYGRMGRHSCLVAESAKMGEQDTRRKLGPPSRTGTVRKGKGWPR